MRVARKRHPCLHYELLQPEPALERGFCSYPAELPLIAPRAAAAPSDPSLHAEALTPHATAARQHMIS